MSASALYQVLGVHGYQVAQVEQDEGRVLLHIEPQPHRICCPECGSRNVLGRGKKERWFRSNRSARPSRVP